MMATPDASMSLTLSTGAKLAVPEGAVGSAVEIAMQRPSDTQAVDFVKTLPSGVQLASAPYVLTPHGLQFEQPVELTLPIASKNHGQLAVVYLENEDDKTWESAGVPEISGSSAKLQVDHFSIWAVVDLKDCVVDADDDLDEAIDEGSCGSAGDDGHDDSVDSAAPSGGVRTESGGGAGAGGAEDEPSTDGPFSERSGPQSGAGGAGAGGAGAGGASASEGGAAGGGADDGDPMSMAPTAADDRCGNGIVDDGQEICDIAIAAGEPGACPTDEACKSMEKPRVCMVVSGGAPLACTASCGPIEFAGGIDVKWQACESTSN